MKQSWGTATTRPHPATRDALRLDAGYGLLSRQSRLRCTLALKWGQHNWGALPPVEVFASVCGGQPVYCEDELDPFEIEPLLEDGLSNRVILTLGEPSPETDADSPLFFFRLRLLFSLASPGSASKTRDSVRCIGNLRVLSTYSARAGASSGVVNSEEKDGLGNLRREHLW